MSDPIEKCPACGRDGFAGEFGVGLHIVRYCSEATDEDEALGRELMSGESHPRKGREMPESAKEAISEANSGRELSEKTRAKISEALEGHEVSEKTRKKISDSLQGENNPWYGVTGEEHPLYGYEWSEEQLEQLSESSSGENAPWFGVTGEDHPWHGVTGEDHPLYGYEWSEEQLERLSEAHKGQLSAGTDQIYVSETDTTVRSGWEAEIDCLLHRSEIEYEYEGRTFDLGDYTYTPDFLCQNDVIVEVKGYVWDGDVDKAEDFMEQHEDATYIVVGSELPSDYHLSWEERDTLPDVIKNFSQ